MRKLRPVGIILAICVAILACDDGSTPTPPERDALLLTLPDFGSLDFEVEVDRGRAVDAGRDADLPDLRVADMASNDMASNDMATGDMATGADDLGPDSADDAVAVDMGEPDALLADMAPAVDAMVCVPAPEVCDAVDNDCDGATDEAFELGQACPVGVPGCMLEGQWACGPGGVRVCVPAAALAEGCDGLDNDCDGQVDEGFGVGAPCFEGVGVCARESTWVCTLDGDAACDAIPVAGMAETCDGRDEDCDGAIDEGLGGAPCDDAVDACGEGAGVMACQAGEMGCVIGAAAQQPLHEICDGIDDDCDGLIDEGVYAHFGRDFNAIADRAFTSAPGVFADVDGDGDPDIVALDSSTSRLFWRENIGGSPGGTRVIQTLLDNRPSLLAADFDGDGDDDLVVNDGYLVNHGGRFAVARPIELGADISNAMAADIDSDGHLDLVHDDDRRLMWRRGDGQGRFSGALEIDPQNGQRENVDLSDLNGDGLVDVFVCCDVNGPDRDGLAYWYMNLGGGAFGERRFVLDVDPFDAAIVGDIDGDGDADVAYLDDLALYLAFNDGAGRFDTIEDPFVARGAGSRFNDLLALHADGRGVIVTDTSVWRFDGVGLAQVPESQVAGVFWPYSIADFDGDGIKDLYDTELIMSRVDGQFETISVSASVSALIDIDQDGIRDALSSSGRWRRTLGTAGFGPVEEGLRAQLEGRFLDMTILDIDSNGTEDVLFRHVGGTISWFPVLPEGGFGPQVRTAVRSTNQPIRVAQLDAEGGADLYFMTNTTLHIHFNPGSNGRRRSVRREIGGLARVVAADVDVDGDIDLVITGDPLRWLPNDGQGGFGAPEVLGAGPVEQAWIAAGDLDGDGDTDLVVVVADTTLALLNDGTGRFDEEVVHQDFVLKAPALVDLDGDGSAAVILQDSQDKDVIIYRHMAGGGFDAGQRLIPLVGQFGFSIFHTDFDADGDVDLYLPANSATSRGMWVENAGPDGFGALQVLGDSVAAAYQLVPTDFDGDGLMDIVYADGDRGIMWVRQFAPRRFARPALLTDQVADPVALVVEDLDADGHLDLLTISLADAALYRLAGQADGFADPQRIADAVGPTELRSLDLDGDGRRDLVTTVNSAHEMAWYRAVDGGFGPRRLITDRARRSDFDSIGIADIDNDGLLDVMTFEDHRFRQPLQWQRQSAPGQFDAPTPIDGFEGSADGFLPYDVDADGDVDLIASSAHVYWYENDGAGRFPTRHDLMPGSLGKITRLSDGTLVGHGGSLLRQAQLTDGRASAAVFFGAHSHHGRIAVADMNGDGVEELVMWGSHGFAIAWAIDACLDPNIRP